MLQDAVSELAPHGVLRAGINLSNFLLVSGHNADGYPQGVAPDMAAAIAIKLGVPVQYVTFPKPGLLADEADKDVWDICLIGNEPARAAKIDFSPAYVEIVASYLVPEESPLKTCAEVDRPGVRVVVEGRTAYELWLTDNIKHAELLRSSGAEATVAQFKTEKLDALANLKPALLKTVQTLPNTRILEGQFTAVQQAIGVARGNLAGAAFIYDFVQDAVRTGLVAKLIERYGVQGLSVAPVG